MFLKYPVCMPESETILKFYDSESVIFLQTLQPWVRDKAITLKQKKCTYLKKIFTMYIFFPKKKDKKKRLVEYIWYTLNFCTFGDTPPPPHLLFAQACEYPIKLFILKKNKNYVILY